MTELRSQNTDSAYPSKQKPLPRPRLRRPTSVSELLRTVIFVLAATILFDMAIPRSLVDGRSMEPTFINGERLVVSRLHYLNDTPTRGEIIVFNSLDAEEAERGVMLIKRVIGLPGETVSVQDGAVFVDGTQLDEPYLDVLRTNCIGDAFRQPYCEVQLGSNEFFVMGDNRNNSKDSRAFGPVPYDEIVGKVLFRFYPLDRIGLIPEADYEL